MFHNGQDLSGWYSKPRPARLCIACPGQIRKLCIYYQNYTLIWAVKYHCYFTTYGPRTIPPQGVWSFAMKRLDVHAAVDVGNSSISKQVYRQ